MSGVRRRIERVVQGVLVGGVTGALASGIPAILIGFASSKGYLGGVVLPLLGVCGIGGGMIGGAVAGFCVALLRPRPSRSRTRWWGRLLLASPLVIALTLFLCFGPFRVWWVNPPLRTILAPQDPTATPVRVPIATPAASKPLEMPFQDFFNAHRFIIDQFIGYSLMNCMLFAPPIYGALIGGRTVRALIDADEPDETGGDARPFLPAIAAIPPLKPDDPDFA